MLLSRVVASGLVNQRQIFVCRGQKTWAYRYFERAQFWRSGQMFGAK